MLTLQRQSGPSRGIFGEWTFAGWGFLIAVFFGWFIELAYGFTTEDNWITGLRTFSLVWFASGTAFFFGAIGGFLFGVPKSVSDPANTPNTPNASQYKTI